MKETESLNQKRRLIHLRISKVEGKGVSNRYTFVDIVTDDSDLSPTTK